MKAEGYAVMFKDGGKIRKDSRIFSTLDGVNAHLAFYRSEGFTAWVIEL